MASPLHGSHPGPKDVGIPRPGDRQVHPPEIVSSRLSATPCLDHLQKTGRIQATFHTPLIQRERWQVPPLD